ncbi:MAG: hypothetical protein JWP10_1404 [Nocardioidaceae bacterium]|nr:hypothetical protein [Nocardioidaceae bacterium]
MVSIYFDEQDEGVALVEALRAEAYDVSVRRVGFAGEDDSQDHAWVVEVAADADRIAALVEVHGGWVASDERVVATPLPLPTGPKKLKRAGSPEETPPAAP